VAGPRRCPECSSPHNDPRAYLATWVNMCNSTASKLPKGDAGLIRFGRGARRVWPGGSGGPPRRGCFAIKGVDIVYAHARAIEQTSTAGIGVPPANDNGLGQSGELADTGFSGESTQGTLPQCVLGNPHWFRSSASITAAAVFPGEDPGRGSGGRDDRRVVAGGLASQAGPDKRS